jgi:hypothetical protein
MADAAVKPTPSLCFDPPPVKKFQIPMPFGGFMKPILDMSKGVPNDCVLVQSLMLQIAPMLAGMECVLRLLKVVMVLKDLINGLPKADFSKVGDVVSAIDELAECFLMLTPAGIGKLIAAILRIIIAYLNCFIDAFMSIYTFQIGLQITEAGDNPILLGNIQCAKQNAEKSQQALMDSMEGAQSLMEILSLLGGIANLELKLPSLSDIAANEDPLQAIEQLRTALEELEQIADSLPV